MRDANHAPLTALNSALAAALWGTLSEDIIIRIRGADNHQSLALAVGLESTDIRTTTIYLTDGHPPLLPLLQQNVDLNAPNFRTSTVVMPNLLSWGQSISPTIPSPPDIILAADCCCKPHFRLLSCCLRLPLELQT